MDRILVPYFFFKVASLAILFQSSQMNTEEAFRLSYYHTDSLENKFLQ